MAIRILNLIGFNAGWFACVLGAAYGFPWTGVVIVGGLLIAHLFIFPHVRNALGLVLLSGVLGYAADSILVLVGTLRFDASVQILGPSPLWMVFMWVNFALALPLSMAFLKGRYGLAALFGAIGGPLAYAAGNKLGAVEIPASLLPWILISIEWASAMPLMSWLASRLDPMATRVAQPSGILGGDDGVFVPASPQRKADTA